MKKVMLISPMLHQGGFERICVMTARLLQEEYEVVIAVFSLDDIAFDVSGCHSRQAAGQPIRGI